MMRSYFHVLANIKLDPDNDPTVIVVTSRKRTMEDLPEPERKGLEDLQDHERKRIALVWLHAIQATTDEKTRTELARLLTFKP
jgi:hypothetical protein